MMEQTAIFNHAVSKEKKNKRRAFVFVFLWMVVAVLGVFYLEISIPELFLAIPQFLSFFATNFFPPDFSSFLDVLDDLVQTIAFAFVAMVFSTLMSLILAMFMAKSVCPWKPVRSVVRAFVSFLRNIPTVIWGSILVYIFGIGVVPGVLALTLALTGFLTKTYADTIDELAGDSLEVMEANGATTLQKIFHGILPAFISSWVNWTLYSFEIGVRASSVLGLVGAGGIGVLIQTRINLFEYQESMALVLYIIVLVLIVDFATSAIRRRIR